MIYINYLYSLTSNINNLTPFLISPRGEMIVPFPSGGRLGRG